MASSSMQSCWWVWLCGYWWTKTPRQSCWDIQDIWPDELLPAIGFGLTVLQYLYIAAVSAGMEAMKIWTMSDSTDIKKQENESWDKDMKMQQLLKWKEVVIRELTAWDARCSILLRVVGPSYCAGEPPTNSTQTLSLSIPERTPNSKIKKKMIWKLLEIFWRAQLLKSCCRGYKHCQLKLKSWYFRWCCIGIQECAKRKEIFNSQLPPFSSENCD